jgi:glycine cleavage system transcriptional repressor
MPRFSLHAVGTNRPGIVSGVTEAIAAMGWDIGESAMTLLAGQFAMVIVLDSGLISDGRLIEQTLGQVVEELDLFLSVRPLDSEPEPFVAGSSISLSVSGANKPGIVAGIAGVLAAAGADIRSLESRMVDGGPGCVMSIVAVVPGETQRSPIEASLLEVASELGVTCTILPLEV